MVERDGPSTSDDAHQLNNIDARYLRHQMKEIKKAKQNGNHPKAERIGVEVLQYFDVEEDSETPILHMVEEAGFSFKGFEGDS